MCTGKIRKYACDTNIPVLDVLRYSIGLAKAYKILDCSFLPGEGYNQPDKNPPGFGA